MEASEAGASPPGGEGAVLVAGAGPVGLALACALRRQGVPCRVVDAKEGPTDQSRALGVQPRTLEVLRALGVADRAIERGRRVRGARFEHGGRTIAELPFDRDEFDTEYPFVLILPQGQTERLLAERLGELGGAVEWRTRLEGFRQDGRGVSATIVGPDGDAEAARFGWLVGCDGAHSTVRHALGLAFEGAAYPEDFTLADVRLDGGFDPDRLSVLLAPAGALAAFPMPEAGRWRLVDTSGRPVADEPGAIVERFRDFLGRAGHAGARLDDPTWATAFRIHRRAVDRLRVGRCFVAGDAAHIHSPAGGQGMNTGIQDAVNLAWKLALVRAGAASEALLDSYQAERRPVAEAVLRETDAATRMITLRGAAAQALRNLALSAVLRVPPARRRVLRRLWELDVSYPDSPIVAEDGRYAFRGGPRPGDRAPDGTLATPDGHPGRLSDVFRSPRHVLLLFEGPAPTAGDDRALRACAELDPFDDPNPLDVHRLGLPGDDRRPGSAAIDADGTLHRRYGARAACLYLVRPDGHVGYRSMPADPHRLDAYLRRLFA